MVRISSKAIKSIVAVVLSCLFYVIIVGIDLIDNKIIVSKFFIPIIMALVAFFTISRDKKRFSKQIFIFPLTILYGFALMGIYILATNSRWPSFSILEPIRLLIPSLIICFGSLPLIYLLVLTKHKNFVIEAMVLYLICLTIDFYELSYLYSLYSYFVSLVCGFTIGYLVNNFNLVYRKNKNLMFFYGLDGFYLDDKSVLDDYVRDEINKLVKEEAKITFYSSRTPASLNNFLKPIDLKYPVITMNGAAIYDFNFKQYVSVVTIFIDISQKLKQIFEQNGYNYFTNIVIHNSHYIYINQISNAGELAYSENVKYRELSNFIYDKSPDDNVVFFLIIDTTDKINYLHSILRKCDFYDDIYIEILEKYQPNEEMKEFSYMKIYSKDIFKLDYLKRYNYEKIAISSSEKDNLILKKFDRVITYDKGPKTIKNKANLIVNSKREHSLIRVIKHLYHKKSV